MATLTKQSEVERLMRSIFLPEIKPREPAVALWGITHFDQCDPIDIIHFAKAYHLSVKYHTFKERKSGESYYRHDCRTASRILMAGFPLKEGTKMLLHEFVEDDDWTFEMLNRDFDEEIAIGVCDVSKGPKIPIELGGRDARIDQHIGTMIEAVSAGRYMTAVRKLSDRADNTTDTAGLSEEDMVRLFDDTEKKLLPFFRWARPFIPDDWQRVIYNLWVQEVEFKCDNHFLKQRCPA